MGNEVTYYGHRSDMLVAQRGHYGQRGDMLWAQR